MLLMKKVVILGNGGNGIFHQMVNHFLNGHTVVYVIDHNLKYSHPNLKKFSALVELKFSDRLLLMIIPRLITGVDIFLSYVYFGSTFQFARLKNFINLPTLKQPIALMLTYSRALKRLDFDYALCLNVYFFGLCSLSVKSKKFIAQPWGSDVNKYGLSSPLRFILMKRSLKSMAYIAPAGRSVIPFMIGTYGIDKSKFVFLPPTVDNTLFTTIPAEEKVKRKLELNLASDTVVFFACRRFKSGWGPEIIKDLFIRLSDIMQNSFFIILSGSEKNELIEKFRDELSPEKRTKFMFLERSISLKEYSYYSQLSDFTVSTMTNRDMQSSSIMQSTACGAYPILLEQEEYKLMVNEGFDAIMFKKIDNLLIDSIRTLANTPTIFDHKRAINRAYFAKREANIDYVTILNNLDLG